MGSGASRRTGSRHGGGRSAPGEAPRSSSATGRTGAHRAGASGGGGATGAGGVSHGRTGGAAAGPSGGPVVGESGTVSLVSRVDEGGFHTSDDVVKVDHTAAPLPPRSGGGGAAAPSAKAVEDIRRDAHRLATMLTGRSHDAERLFLQYDADRDGFLSPPELHAGLQQWKLNLKADMFAQFVECNFLYADRDGDGCLSLAEFTQLFKLISEVSKKFTRCDEDCDGLITKADFALIVRDLNLALTGVMLKQYIDMNFKFVDRTLSGRISFGQFLACYANFLYSYEISQGMRQRRTQAKGASKPLQPPARQMDGNTAGDVLGTSSASRVY